MAEDTGNKIRELIDANCKSMSNAELLNILQPNPSIIPRTHQVTLTDSSGTFAMITEDYAKKHFELLEFAADCVLDGIITKKVYIRIKALIKTFDPDNIELAEKILNAKCEE